MVAEPELQPPGRVLALLEVMKKGKDNGWEGAFGFICCLITLVWARAPIPKPGRFGDPNGVLPGAGI